MNMTNRDEKVKNGLTAQVPGQSFQAALFFPCCPQDGQRLLGVFRLVFQPAAACRQLPRPRFAPTGEVSVAERNETIMNADYPLRFDALADAGRMYAHAGNREAALGAFARIDAEATDYQLAPHMRAQRAELLAGQ